MVSEKLFAGIPPFPDDIPTMPMYTVSLGDLCARDERAAHTMFTACQELGFFLLDLRQSELGESMIQEIDSLFVVGKEIMSLPEDIKEQYLHDMPRSFLG